MSIFFVVGKPGGGKSYYGVKQMVDEIVSGDRYVVSNIELNLPELRKFIHDEEKDPFTLENPGGVKDDIDLSSRVRVLDDAETGQFWLYEPGRDFTNRKKVPVGQRTLEVPDFEDRAKRGCLYVIDEVHVHFGAREWQHTGADCTFFLSQHRKLRCDVILITQHPDQVDKALRRLAQDYVMMRNLSREPIMGFRIGNLFRWSQSMNSPTSANPRVFDGGFIKLDVTRYGKLYDTMAGVGIQGRVSPKIEARGRSLWWLLPPAVLIVWLVFCGPSMILKHGSAWFGSMAGRMFKNPQAVTAVSRVVPLPVSNGVPSSVPAASTVPASAVPQSVSVAGDTKATVAKDDSDGVVMLGYYHFGNVWHVFLSDGRQVTSEEPEFETLTSNGLKYAGRYYHRALVVGAAHATPAPSVGAVASVATRQASASVFAPSSPSASPMPQSGDVGRPVAIHWQDGTTTHHRMTASVAEVAP